MVEDQEENILKSGRIVMKKIVEDPMQRSLKTDRKTNDDKVTLQKTGNSRGCWWRQNESNDPLA